MGKVYVDGQKKVGGAAAKVGLASEEGDGKGGDGCRSKTGEDGNDEDGKRKNQSKTGPLVPDDDSGKNVLMTKKNI